MICWKNRHACEEAKINSDTLRDQMPRLLPIRSSDFSAVENCNKDTNQERGECMDIAMTNGARQYDKQKIAEVYAVTNKTTEVRERKRRRKKR